MKLSVQKKVDRQKRKEARKLKQRSQSPPVNNSIYTVAKPMASFAFNPGTILNQPHTWLMSRLYKMPLKERLAEFARFDTYTKVFMSFREETFKEYMIEMRLRFVFRKLMNAWLRRISSILLRSIRSKHPYMSMTVVSVGAMSLRPNLSTRPSRKTCSPSNILCLIQRDRSIF